MKVVIRLFGGLKSEKDFPKNEEGDIIFEFSEPFTVCQLIDSLGLNKTPYIVVLNGVIINEFSLPLRDADEVSLFPPIAGGAW
jgi:molybdopterin synthase sulfur carrier subunit